MPSDYRPEPVKSRSTSSSSAGARRALSDERTASTASSAESTRIRKAGSASMRRGRQPARSVTLAPSTWRERFPDAPIDASGLEQARLQLVVVAAHLRSALSAQPEQAEQALDDDVARQAALLAQLEDRRLPGDPGAHHLDPLRRRLRRRRRGEEAVEHARQLVAAARPHARRTRAPTGSRRARSAARTRRRVPARGQPGIAERLPQLGVALVQPLVDGVPVHAESLADGIRPRARGGSRARAPRACAPGVARRSASRSKSCSKRVVGIDRIAGVPVLGQRRLALAAEELDDLPVDDLVDHDAVRDRCSVRPRASSPISRSITRCATS